MAMRRLVPLLVALGLGLGLTVGVPTVALAHDVLEKTVPANGTNVAVLPDSVVLVFSEEPLEIGLQVVVTGPTGNVADGIAAINGREVRQRIAATAPAGTYTVAYRVTSADGHPITGSFGFHARTGLDGSTATAPPSVHVPPAKDPGTEAAKDSQLVPVALTAAGTAVAIALIAFVVLRGKRRTPAA
jgi:methionine-rich copper-binding protein CopC